MTDSPSLPVQRRIQPHRKCKRLPEVPAPRALAERASRPKRTNKSAENQSSVGKEAKPTSTMAKMRTSSSSRWVTSDSSKIVVSLRGEASRTLRTTSSKKKSINIGETVVEGPNTNVSSSKQKRRQDSDLAVASIPKRRRTPLSLPQTLSRSEPSTTKQTPTRKGGQPTVPSLAVPKTPGNFDAAGQETGKVEVVRVTSKTYTSLSRPMSIERAEGGSTSTSAPSANPVDEAQEDNNNAIQAEEGLRVKPLLTARLQEELPGFAFEVLPDGHKLVHVMRHCRSWHNLRRRGEEHLYDIHDPGLSPGGITEAKLFPQRFRLLQNPGIVVTSPLRRCLQTTVHAFGEGIRSGTIRAVAHPDLQEVSNRPCDTGTPLNVLRREFPLIEFPDDLFPEIWPREATTMMVKANTIYDDKPNLHYERSVRIRGWLKELEESEIVLVTHASFAHYMFNDWFGSPGAPRSQSFAPQLGHGTSQTLTLPGKDVPGIEFGAYARGMGPTYPPQSLQEDYIPKVYRSGARDCGIFTDQSLR